MLLSYRNHPEATAAKFRGDRIVRQDLRAQVWAARPLALRGEPR